MRVLDVGGGLGGPARTFASVFGCTVEMLDITKEFCRAGTALTAQTGLSDLLSFRHGSALDMPYPDGSFDMVWTQHSSMNIADKARLYQGIHLSCVPADAWRCTRSWPAQHLPSPSRSRGRASRAQAS